MKRIIALLLSVMMILSLTAAAFADESGDYFYIDELGMNLAFPADGYVVFTRGVAADDPNLKAYGLTQESLVEYFAAQSIYFDAWDETVSHELVVTMTENPYESLDGLSSAILKLVKSSVSEQYSALGYEVTDSEYTEINGITYMVLHIVLASDAASDNILQYFTIVDHMAINFAWHNYREELAQADEELMQDLMDSVIFGESLVPQAEPAAAADDSSSKKLGTRG